MDYIHHYNDNSDSSINNDDNEDVKDIQTIKCESESIKISSSKSIHQQKRKRKLECEKTVASTTASTAITCNKRLNDKIILLSSPNDINLYPNHGFVRNSPHIPGNWAGNIYISLNPTFKTRRLSKQHSNSNVNSYQRLKEFACQNIKSVHNQWIEIANKRQLLDDEDIVMVPHFNMNRVDDRSSSCSNHSDDSSDDNVSHSSMESENDIECEEDNLHISLSKPFFLQKHSIKPFYDELQLRLNLIEPFLIRSSTTLEVLVNDKQTRSFLTLPFSDCCSSHATTGNNKDGNKLKSLIAVIDSVMIKFGLDCYYEDPKFHCSIASWKGSYSNQDWIGNDKRIATDTNKNCNETHSTFTFMIQGVHCDFGSTEKKFIEFAKR